MCIRDRLGHSDAQHAADLGRGGHDVLALQRAAIGQVILEGGDIAAVQLLDQVQGTGQALSLIHI